MQNDYFGYRGYGSAFGVFDSQNTDDYYDYYGNHYNRFYATLSNLSIGFDLLAQYPITKSFGIGLYGGVGIGISMYDDQTGHYYTWFNNDPQFDYRIGFSMSGQGGVSLIFGHSSIEAGVLYLQTFGIPTKMRAYPSINGKYDGDMISYLITYQYTF